ncbi:MAG: ATP-dependent sacrificial sulfur transferase LarE [Candidatus Helarchaeota archaeon]
MDTQLKEKVQKVKKLLQNKKVLVAFSGGVDSSVVTRLAKEYCSKVIAATIISELNPPSELEEAERVAHELNIEWRTIKIQELENPQFRANPPNRCYYCKKDIMSALKKLARHENVDIIIDGTNADDLSDFRPGQLALKEFNIVSPLAQADITKEEIRKLANFFGLSVHDKPAMACLASRIPYGEEITEKKLQMIAEAEKAIYELIHPKMVRVRYHGNGARIEVLPEERSKFFDIEKIEQIVKILKRLGFIYVMLDLQGYRTGSLNEPLDSS